MLTLLGLSLVLGGSAVGIFRLILNSLDDEHQYDIPQFNGVRPLVPTTTDNEHLAYIRYLENELRQVNLKAQQTESLVNTGNSPVHPSPFTTGSPDNSQPVHPDEFDTPDNRQRLRHALLLSYTKREALEEIFGLTSKDKSGNPHSKYQKASRLFDLVKSECEQSLSAEYRQLLEGAYGN